MNEEEQIKNIVRELNSTKSEVVTAAKDYVNHGKKVITHTSKEQDKSGNIVTTVKKAVEFMTADIPDIIISGGPVPPRPNTVKITSPLGANSPYTNVPIPIRFKVDGPHHDDGKNYVYIIIITDANGKKVFDKAGENRGITNRKGDVNHANPLNLPDGQYTIQITTADPTTKKILKQSDKEVFVIKTGAGPGPVINNIIKNIIINNNTNIYNVNIPFSMPLEIILQLSDLKHINEIISQPIDIRISVTKEDSSARLFPPIDDILIGGVAHVDGLKYTLNTEIPFKEEGKFNLFVIIHIKEKVLFRKIVPIQIKEKKTVTPRRGAIFTLHVDGTDYADGNKFQSQISKSGKPIVFEIENSGGGTLKYDFAIVDEWLTITTDPKSRSLTSGKKGVIKVALDVGKLKPGQKTASLVVKGMAGNTRQLAESWIYFNIVD